MKRWIFAGLLVVNALVFGFYYVAQAKMEMKEMPTSGIFEGIGKVIGVVPSTGEIILQHEEVKGLMKAMTMGYSVKPVDLLKGLRPGDTIKFKIDAGSKAIVAIESLKK